MPETLVEAISKRLLILLRFGGPGSGFYGHTGRSLEKKRGGSVARGSTAALGGVSVIIGKPEMKIINDMKIGTQGLTEFFGLPGVECQVTCPKAEAEHYDPFWRKYTDALVRVLGQYFDENGDLVAQCGRTLTVDRDGKRHADFSFLTIERANQKQGWATQLYQHQINVLRARGYEDVRLEAALTIGRYAWAKKGFDYETSGMAAHMVEKFNRWCYSKGLGKSWPKFQHASDVANYDDGRRIDSRYIINPDVERADLPLGKAFMLDMGSTGHGPWAGILYLQKKTPRRKQDTSAQYPLL